MRRPARAQGHLGLCDAAARPTCGVINPHPAASQARHTGGTEPSPFSLYKTIQFREDRLIPAPESPNFF